MLVVYKPNTDLATSVRQDQLVLGGIKPGTSGNDSVRFLFVDGVNNTQYKMFMQRVIVHDERLNLYNVPDLLKLKGSAVSNICLSRQSSGRRAMIYELEQLVLTTLNNEIRVLQCVRPGFARSSIATTRTLAPLAMPAANLPVKVSLPDRVRRSKRKLPAETLFSVSRCELNVSCVKQNKWSLMEHDNSSFVLAAYNCDKQVDLYRYLKADELARTVPTMLTLRVVVHNRSAEPELGKQLLDAVLDSHGHIDNARLVELLTLLQTTGACEIVNLSPTITRLACDAAVQVDAGIIHSLD